MVKVTVKIDGMYCGMCEAHINDVIRNHFPKVEKVSSSYKNGETTFLSEESISEDEIKQIISPTGYRVEGIHEEPYEKKKWF